MNRRDFLGQVAAWTAGTLLVPPTFRIGESRAMAQAPAAPKLAVAKGKDYAKLVRLALEPLGGMSAFVKQGQKVVVKPNIGWDRSPDQAANTHPEIIGAIVREVLEAGAARVMVFDHTCNDARRSYNNSGILPAVEAIKDKRASCVFTDDRKFVPVNIENGKAVAKWEFYRDALEADCYINVPVAKHHSLARLTMGLKNVMGVVGGNRGSLHDGLGQKIVDLNRVIRPKITFIDATRILLRNGPQGGDIRDVQVRDTLVASADPVAADAYTTTLFELEPGAIETTVAAHAAGLGEMDLSKVEVIQV